MQVSDLDMENKSSEDGAVVSISTFAAGRLISAAEARKHVFFSLFDYSCSYAGTDIPGFAASS